MGNYRSCLYEKTYHGYFRCMGSYINQQFKEISCLIKTKSGMVTLPENLIFHTLYTSEYDTSSNISYLIVLLERVDGKKVKYIVDIGKKRGDIYFDIYHRTKTPESILLTSQDDDYNNNDFKKKDIKKLIEARAYLKTVEDIEKLSKMISQKLDNIFYVPLSLSLILLLDNLQYFPKIYYISRPYTIETPYVYKIVYKSYGVTKKPIKTYNKDLNFLSIIDFEKYPTMEPYLLGLDYDFELDRRNLNKFEIQINYDELEHRFYNSITKIVETISISKICPEDIGPYQIIVDNNGNIKFIDFASGLKIPTSQKGLEKIIIETIKDIIIGTKESPLLKYCKKVENMVVCNEKIINPNFPKMLVDNIEKQLEEQLKYYGNRLDKLIKNIMIGNIKLSDIIYQHRKDEFKKNIESVSIALELYLKSLKSHNN